MSGSSQISVVIPTRNRPVLLVRAVNSVLSQSHTNLEVLIVIDGPDPATEEALRAISDTRLRVFPLPDRVGGSETRNLGAREARGEWLAYLDDDDEWLPQKLELQLVLAQSVKAENFLIGCRITARTPRADYEWPRRYPNPGEPLSEYLLTRKSLFRGEGSIQTSTFFAKKSLFEKCPFRVGQVKHQDTDWLLRAAQLPGFEVHFVNQILAIHYIEEERTSVSSQVNWKYSYDWARQHRDLFTRRAYSGFLINNLSPEAAEAHAWSAFFPLLKDSLVHGKPYPREFAMFLGMWFMPRSLRRRSRDLLGKLGLVRIRPN